MSRTAEAQPAVEDEALCMKLYRSWEKGISGISRVSSTYLRLRRRASGLPGFLDGKLDARPEPAPAAERRDYRLQQRF